VLGFSLIALAGCSSLSPTTDPVYLRLQDIDARLIRIERVIENESLIELSSQLTQLQAETASLRGEIETLRYESENSAARDRDLYIDVDTRLQNLERGQTRVVPPAGSGAQTPGQAAAPPSAVGDQEAYNAAFGLIQNRRYEEATRAFTDFLVVYPESSLRDNAQYWLAETYYVRRQFAVALPEFQTVLDAYPQSAKLADALLKVGYCNHELGQIDAARTALREVQRLYPETTAARLATQRLERISQETG
jgi:tol-pal system protein YbgF